MIPSYRELMPRVLRAGLNGEVRIRDVVEQIAEELDLSEIERTHLLPSGKQTTFSNRVHWARSYLKQAGLVRSPRLGVYMTTDIGRMALESGETVYAEYLKRFEAFQKFRSGGKASQETQESPSEP